MKLVSFAEPQPNPNSVDENTITSSVSEATGSSASQRLKKSLTVIPSRLSRTDTRLPSLKLFCADCLSQNLNKSRALWYERPIIYLLPKRPYRCADCYRRFWCKEPLLSDVRRLRTWICLGLFIGLILLWQLFTVGSSDIGDIVGTNPGNSQATVHAPVSSAVVPLAEEPAQPVASLPAAKAAPEFSIMAVTPSDNVQISEIQPTPTEPTEGFSSSIPSAERLTEQMLELRQAVETWRSAWQAGDAQRYLGVYAASFVPQNGVDYSSWRQQRLSRVQPAKNITVTVSDVSYQILPDPNWANVSFHQHYQSATYQELSLKQLRFKKGPKGWKIVSEEQLK